MRVFLSCFDNFNLAIPIEYVASIMIYHKNNNNDNQNDDYQYISLPEIFNYQNINTHHGLIIKNSNCILLTSKVDCEIDIPQKDIFSIPKTMSVLQFSRFFSGINISQNTQQGCKLILFLNPIQLIKYKHGEKND